MSPGREYLLKVGESAQVKRGYVLTAGYALVYAGMPNEATYSIVVTREYGNQAMAYNLFIARDQTEVDLPIGRLTVFHVTPAEIRLRFQA